jgi:hypothetical protein
MVRVVQMSVLLALAAAFGCDKGARPIPHHDGPPPPGARTTDLRPPPRAATEATPAPPASTPDEATITGVVTFAGALPALPAVDRSRDPGCPQDGSPGPWLSVGEAGALASAVVWVDLPAGGEPIPPTTPAFIDQQGCAYHPFVTALVAGQKVRIRNSDDTFHDIHGSKGGQTTFNEAHMQGSPDKIMRFTIGGPAHALKLACDVHPWMEAWVVDFPGRAFAVTGADGRFTLAGLPAMKATVHVWQPYLGEKTIGVVTTPGITVTANLPAFTPADYTGPRS